MSLRTATQSRLVLNEQTRAFLAADPHAPVSVRIQAPGGYGKTAILHELGRIYREAGITVTQQWSGGADDPDRVLLVDDAHLLDERHLREMRHLVEARRLRLAIAYRPWPRPSALVELTDVLKRHGSPLVLSPFSEEQTAARLTATLSCEPALELANFVHARSGGVPRFVDRLARALGECGDVALTGPSFEVPEAAVIQFGPDLEDLDGDVRRLLLAAAAGVELPVHVLRSLLSSGADTVDDTLAAAQGDRTAGTGQQARPDGATGRRFAQPRGLPGRRVAAVG